MTRIARSFGRAAAQYEQHAGLQRRVAARLLTLAAEQFALPPRRVLEVGCGTGILTRALRQRWPAAQMMCVDIAPEMVAMCRAGVGADAGIGFAVADGMALPCGGPFDLVISSMTAQWFRDPGATLGDWRALLAPGGCVAVALPVAGSLAEWEAALRLSGLPSGLVAFPAPDALANMTVTVEGYVTHYAHGMDFLREIRGIGGTTPRSGYVPLGVPDLQQAVAAFENLGARISWQIAFGLIGHRIKGAS